MPQPDTRPESEKVAADVRARILSGDLSPGERLPSIPSLAAELGMSTMAIQTAWRILRDEGYIVSRKGAGVFVRDREPFVVDAAAWFAPASRGVTYTLLAVEETTPPREVVEALGAERAVLRNRLMRRDSDPVEVSWSYYPLPLVAGTALTGRAKIRGGAPAVLAELGYPQRSFVDRLSVRPPTRREAELLEMPGGVPVFRQFRIVLGGDEGRPVEVSVLIKPGHLYELRYTQDIPDEA